MVRGMALTAHMVTIDCADPKSLAGFWTEALGYEVVADLPAGASPRVRVRRLPARSVLFSADIAALARHAGHPPTRFG